MSTYQRMPVCIVIGQERQLVQRVALSRLTTAGVWPKIGLLSRCVQKWDARVVVVVTRMDVLQ